MIRLSLAGLLAVLSFSAAPAAHAATVVVEDDVIVFKGTGDEPNSVNVRAFVHETYGPMIQISDTDADFTAYPADVCELPENGYFVNCLYGDKGFRLELGGGDDFARVDADTSGDTATSPIPGTVLGGAGADRLDDQSSVDGASIGLRTFDGGPGNDKISAYAGHQVLLGGDGNDELDGGAGDDEVRGGPGDDTVMGDRYSAPGADIIDGGPGNDLGDEWSIPTSDTVNEAVTIIQDGVGGDGRPGENDNVTSIERFSSGMFGTIEGTEAVDSIVTHGDGNSVIRGLAGDDKITTGASKEEIDGGAGADTIQGGFGDDRITGGPGPDVINADGGSYCGIYDCSVPFGNDQVFVRDGEIDSVECGVGQDSVVADANDVIAASCETVDTGAGAPGGPGGATGGGAAGGGAAGGGAAGGGAAMPGLATKASLRTLLRTGAVFTVPCTGACEVRATLAYKGKAIGSGRKTLLAGGSARVPVKLSKKGKRVLKRLKKTKLTLRVTITDAAGKSTTVARSFAFKK